MRTSSVDDVLGYREITRVFCWFFAVLAFLALLSAPEATHDEMFHATNIWCGQGEREPYCSGIRLDVDSPGALVSIDWVTCQRDVTHPLVCARDRSGEAFRTVNHNNLYPGLYYWALSWFVIPSFEQSIVFARLASALAIAAVLALLTSLLPSRERLVLFLVVLTALPSTGHFLFSSINPSSWTALGVGFGWLALHASMTLERGLDQRRIALVVVSVLMFGMAVGSRWDAIPMIGFTSLLVVARRFTRRGIGPIRSILVFTVFVSGLVFILQGNYHLSPSRLVPVLFTFSQGEPNNLTFVSHYLLYALPNTLGALGTVPSLSGIYVPAVVGTANLALLVVLVVAAANRRNRVQSLGALLSVLMIAMTIATHVALVDNRDPFGIEPRYVFPMLPFVVGWWFLFGPERLEDRVYKYLNGGIVVAVLIFGIWTFSIAERFVDRQTFGLRLLPEGRDQWWWSWLPIGPNLVLMMAVFSYGIFLRRFRALVAINRSGVE